MSFRALQEPQPETAGDNVGEWFVYAVYDVSYDIEVFALLADGSLSLAVVNIGDDGDPFYFVDELAAYRASYDYYNTHGLVYPFLARLIELETKFGIGKSTGGIQSEVMEF